MAKRVRLPKAEREAFWRRQIDDWAQGGQTISGFCRERGLTESHRIGRGRGFAPYRAQRVASAKANRVEPFAYLRDLPVQLSRHEPPTAALLPDAWLAAHPESRRCWSR